MHLYSYLHTTQCAEIPCKLYHIYSFRVIALLIYLNFAIAAEYTSNFYSVVSLTVFFVQKET